MSEHDLVLVGATGFVGRLTAAQLARHAPPGLRIALAGRSAERLAELRAELSAELGAEPRAEYRSTPADWPLLTVDLTDPEAVDRLAGSSRVVATAAGPYARYGLPLVQACARHGIGYADLTGETLFVRRSIELAHETAVRSGAPIVHACGFDSIPSDLGVALTAERAAADGQGTLTATVLHVRTLRGGVSGGTIDSLRQQLIDIGAQPDLREMAGSPYALTGETDAPTDVQHAGSPIRRDPDSLRWQVPFVLGGFNRQIVLRTDALLDHAYGEGFRYREVLDTGRGPLGAVLGAALVAAIWALVAGMSAPPTRAVLDRLLPDPGDGPDERTRRQGRFRVAVHATTTTGARYKTTVAAPYDPGYGGTAVLLAETALALAGDELPDRAGVLTPMTAIGTKLADRLRNRDFTVQTRRLS